MIERSRVRVGADTCSIDETNHPTGGTPEAGQDIHILARRFTVECVKFTEDL